MQILAVIILLGLGFGASPYIVWQRIVDNGSTDKAHGLAFSPGEDAIVMTGETGDIPQDILVYKLSRSDGDSIWVKTLDNEGAEDIGCDVAVAAGGKIFLGATTKVGSDPKIFIALYSNGGDESWRKNITLPGENGRPSLACRDEDSCYLASWYISGSNLRTNVMLADDDGSFFSLWDAPAPSSYALSGVDIDNAGNVYSCASEKGGIILDKMNGDGTYYWDKSYTEASVTLNGWSCRTALSQKIFLCGEWTKINVDALLLKWNSSGDQLFNPAKHYDLGHNEFCRDLAVDVISDCYLAGWQQRGEEEDLLVIKTDSSGNLLWSWVDTLAGKQEIEAVEIDNFGYLYLAGSTQTGTNWDATVSKVRQLISIEGEIMLIGGSKSEFSSGGTYMKVTGDTDVLIPLDMDSSHYKIELYNGGNYHIIPQTENWSYYPESGTGDYHPLAYRMFNQNFIGELGVVETKEDVFHSLEVKGGEVLFSLPADERGVVSIYDASGHRLLSRTVHNSGIISLQSNLVCGVYFVRLVTKDFSETIKCVIVR